MIVWRFAPNVLPSGLVDMANRQPDVAPRAAVQANVAKATQFDHPAMLDSAGNPDLELMPNHHAARSATAVAVDPGHLFRPLGATGAGIDSLGIHDVNLRCRRGRDEHDVRTIGAAGLAYPLNWRFLRRFIPRCRPFRRTVGPRRSPSPELVVQLRATSRVRKNLVGFLNFLESPLRLLPPVAIRMEALGQAAVSSFDIRRCGRRLHAEDLITILDQAAEGKSTRKAGDSSACASSMVEEDIGVECLHCDHSRSALSGWGDTTATQATHLGSE